MSAYFDIVVLLFVVAMVVMKLRSLLGTKPENETRISRESAAKIFEIIAKEQQNAKVAEGGVLKAVNLSELSPTDRLLLKIPHFNKEKFLQNAERAFEVIVAAFARGDTAALIPLLDAKLLAKFATVIEERKQAGVTAETDFVGFDSSEITNVKIGKSGIATICVRFVSEQINLLRNAAGEVLEGDENFIQKITDVWTFERNINSVSPVWLLVSTKK